MEFFFTGTTIESRFQHNKGFDPEKMCGANVFHDYGTDNESRERSMGGAADFTKKNDDNPFLTKNFEDDTGKSKKRVAFWLGDFLNFAFSGLFVLFNSSFFFLILISFFTLTHIPSLNYNEKSRRYFAISDFLHYRQKRSNTEFCWKKGEQSLIKT